MTIPQSETLSTSTMKRVFDSTTAMYKFYWLLSLLDIHVKEQKDIMPALDVASRAVDIARLSGFGSCTNLFFDYKRDLKSSPTERHEQLQKQGDEDLYKIE